MARKNLHAQLVAKSESLRSTEVTQSAASVAFIAASAEAKAKANIAANHARAVEDAVAILEEAGVVL